MNNKKTPEVPKNESAAPAEASTPQDLKNLEQSVRAGAPAVTPRPTRETAPQDLNSVNIKIKDRRTWFEKYMKGDAGVDEKGQMQKGWLTLGTLGNVLGLKWVEGIGAPIGSATARALGAGEETAENVGYYTGKTARIAAIAAVAYGAWQLAAGLFNAGGTTAAAATETALHLQESGAPLAAPVTLPYAPPAPISSPVLPPVAPAPLPSNIPFQFGS